MSRTAKVKQPMEATGQLVRVNRVGPYTFFSPRESELYISEKMVGALVDFDRDSKPVILWSDMRITYTSLAHLEFV